MFTTVLLLMRANGDAPARPRFFEKVRRMHHHLAALATPSGQVPHVGDCDDGRTELLLDDLQQMVDVPVLKRNALHVSNLLGLGKYLFEEGVGSTEDAKWYGFAESAQPVAAVTPAKVEVFPHSGVAIARTGPADILFFAVRNGIHGKGSHNHNDKLSVILRMDGQEVLCDSGTGSYTREIAFRNRFRVTRAHNTATVDGKEQCAIDFTRAGLFRLGTEAKVSRIKQVNKGSSISLQASHSGYCSLGVTHSRTILVGDAEAKACLEDQFSGTGIHQVEVHFQVAHPWRTTRVTYAESGVRCVLEGPRQLEIFVGAPCTVQMQQCETEISTTYGATTPASRITFSCQLNLPASITTEISWAS
jgi:hypothetical protein